MKIEIYSRDNCPYCVKAKEAFKQAGYEYTEYKVGINANKVDVQARVDALGLSVVINTVPQIFITSDDGVEQYIGGYSDLIRLCPWATKKAS